MEIFSSVDKAFLVGVDVRHSGGLEVEASLEELHLLADTANIEVVGQATQKVNHPDPATYIGSGKVEEVKYWIENLGANVVIFDDELSPRHQRELEKAFSDDVRVLDRTALILDIFASHARTKAGRIQVELAQYQYRLPRLTRAWTHLARQAGGAAARGGSGGVGLRGPGETQLETDRREIQRRITHLRNELENVRAHRSRQRSKRREAAIPIVSLVGYTNAGKSTLLNALSGAGVYAADQLFATLDPTTRRVSLPSGHDFLLTDTVGFIQKLPHSLFDAFQATLEGISEAEIVLHVVDASNPHMFEHIQTVQSVLYNDLKLESLEQLLVFNKLDQLEADQIVELKATYSEDLFVSAHTGEGLDELRAHLDELLSAKLIRLKVVVPYTRGDLISKFYDNAAVENEEHTDSGLILTGLLPAQIAYIYKEFELLSHSD